MCSLIPLLSLKSTPTSEIYTLSLHDALPISPCPPRSIQSPTRAPALARPRSSTCAARLRQRGQPRARRRAAHVEDRKSTRLNSSHITISYAVFCLKKKKTKIQHKK